MAEMAATGLAEIDSPSNEIQQSVTDAQSGTADKNTTQNNGFLASVGAEAMVRQFALLVGLAASVALGFAVVLWSQGEDYQPIYGNMDGYDASLIMTTLENEGVDFQVDPGSGVILVPTESVATIRMRLAAAGVNRFDGTGYELLDEDVGLGGSKYMEANRVKRSQEGELQRTISSFRNVQSARVHIAIPERSVFVRDNIKPSASVFLVLNSGAGLSDTQISAISNLVASSVPELMNDDVTIVDQRGRLLTQKGPDTTLDLADRQFEYVRKYEQSLIDRISGILTPIVGVEGFRSQVTADVDFTQTEAADERYDPQPQALRSEQSLQEQRIGDTTPIGIPGALTNQPPLDGNAPEVAGIIGPPGTETITNKREQHTRNYEIGRSISYTNHDPVTVRRLSIAVVLDNRLDAATGELTPWPDEQLSQITALVRNAVGFSEQRGDSVSVINNSFSPIELLPTVALPLWRELWFVSLVKQVAAGVFVLLMLLLVLRPVMKNLSASNSESSELALAAQKGELSALTEAEQELTADKVELASKENRDGYLPGPR